MTELSDDIAQLEEIHDRDEYRVGEAITPEIHAHAASTASNVVETELRLHLVRPAERRLEAIEATQYLTKAHGIIEGILATLAQRYTKAQWLWMLRRLPVRVWQGDVSTTAPYRAALAEIITGVSGSSEERLPFVDENRATRFSLYEGDIRRALAFAEITRWLFGVQVKLRYAGKGASFVFKRSCIPSTNVSSDIQKYVSLYDARIGSDTGNVLPRTGTVLTRPAPAAQGQILACYHMSPVWVPFELETASGSAQQRGRLLARFIPELIRIDQLADLNSDSRLSGHVWWSSETQRLLLLLAVLPAFFLTNRTMMSFMQFGYVPVDLGHLEEGIANLMPVATELIGSLLRVSVTPESAASTVEALTNIAGRTWPLQPGPAIRRIGRFAWIDVVAATAMLERALAFPKVDGPVANARADHFELTVQNIIDASAWKPSSVQGSRARNPLRRGGRDLTDIDAIGERQGVLLIVSCKSVLYTNAYDAGSYTSVRNARSIVEQEVVRWRSFGEDLLKHPVGSNFDFSNFSSIIAIVCTPTVVYVEDEGALQMIAPGLRAACSIGELREWLPCLGTHFNPEDMPP
jgi:hypothetical protein